MATRILISNTDGTPLCCLDGHHGARHAAEWAATMRARFAAEGVAVLVHEMHPAAGGDDFRADVLQRLGRLRVGLHTRPDGGVEVVGLAGCTLRLVYAPIQFVGQRHAIRVPQGRHNVPAAKPRTHDQQRLVRRHHRALLRAAR